METKPSISSTWGWPLIVLFALAPDLANAACVYKPFTFHPEKNDGVVVDVLTDHTSSCLHQFEEGPGYKFTSIIVERQPEHGTLANKSGAYVYTPAKGFSGKDAYMFKICATKGAEQGCSAIAFVAVVK